MFIEILSVMELILIIKSYLGQEYDSDSPCRVVGKIVEIGLDVVHGCPLLVTLHIDMEGVKKMSKRLLLPKVMLVFLKSGSLVG